MTRLLLGKWRSLYRRLVRSEIPDGQVCVSHCWDGEAGWRKGKTGFHGAQGKAGAKRDAREGIG
jgi:hypothetical protein